MKSRKIKFLETLLRLMAIVVLKRHRPMVVGVTGSVGKSSTKEAIALVLGARFLVRANPFNYNNEIGIPLTIIGAMSGKRSLLAWIGVGVRWLITCIGLTRYPDILVLEMGVDRPGDLDYLLGFVPVQVGVLTDISESHLEYFGTLKQIAREKSKLIAALPASGAAVVNADNSLTLAALKKTKAAPWKFGFNESATVRAEHLAVGHANKAGLTFKLNYLGTHVPVKLPHLVARYQTLGPLAAIAVGLYYKIHLMDITVALETFETLPGRLRVLAGTRHSTILDDTYNAAPRSLKVALDALGEYATGRRLAILGDMLELGEEEIAAHTLVGAWLQTANIDHVLLVGPRMQHTYDALQAAGFPETRFGWLSDPVSAGNVVSQMLRPGDTVLVKGSQGMRMELAVERLLAHPERDRSLLCRQSPDWKAKPFVIPKT